MPWTRCTGEKGCGGRYNTDKCMPCITDEETPEELESFRWSPEWMEHESHAKMASERGRFGSMIHSASCVHGRVDLMETIDEWWEEYMCEG